MVVAAVTVQGVARGDRIPASVRADRVREYALHAIVDESMPEARKDLATYVREEAARRRISTLRGRLLERLSVAADSILLIDHWQREMGGNDVAEPVLHWLVRSNERLALLLNTLSPDDRGPRAMHSLSAIHNPDPGGPDAYFRLALAIAIVWDQPRPQPHPQTGSSLLSFDFDPVARFHYFKHLYAEGDAEVRYRNVSIRDLKFVVCSAVPLSELRWARRNVRGGSRSWDDKYEDVAYNQGRVVRGEFDWPHGAYTLESIREHGGICVDQAYYGAVTARAHGIPAMLFVGQGRRGLHAWFGYMEREDEWNLEAGRYRYDNYATGVAVEPQLNRSMSDHDLEYFRDRGLRSPAAREAARLVRLGAVLRQLGEMQKAYECGARARKIVPRYDPAWALQEALLMKADSRQALEECVELLDSKATNFRRYPDFVARIRQRQADLLQQLGRNDDAERILRVNQSRLARDRDDLGRFLGIEQIKAVLQRGDTHEARDIFEDVLKDHRHEGMKAVQLVRAYLNLTRETGQTEEAVDFLRRYLPRMHRRSNGESLHGPVFLELLVQAYVNDGDTRGAERARRRLERARD